MGFDSVMGVAFNACSTRKKEASMRATLLGMVSKSPAIVMPANAGIQFRNDLSGVFQPKPWIPACARMTNFFKFFLGMVVVLGLSGMAQAVDKKSEKASAAQFFSEMIA